MPEAREMCCLHSPLNSPHGRYSTFVVPMGISPMGNSGHFPPKKPAATVVLTNPNYKIKTSLPSAQSNCNFVDSDEVRKRSHESFARKVTFKDVHMVQKKEEEMKGRG